MAGEPTSVAREPGRAPARPAELSPLHDFAAKLTQPSVIDHLRAYVEWQIARRAAATAGDPTGSAAPGDPPALAPLSINLDLTTACNYRCDHCIDLASLNLGVRYDDGELFDSLATLAGRGLRSVILIGGGEPTLYPRFAELVRHVKGLGLALGLVTNGGRMDRVLDVAGVLEPRDWIRLSLDSATDETFQIMHRPRRPVTLDEICAGVPPVKERNPDVRVGYSFIVVWRGCTGNDTGLHENLDEMVGAAERAKAHRFDYISFKPFLTRAESNNAEVVDLTRRQRRLREVVEQIRRNVDAAKRLADDGFAVVESTNLLVLENGTYRDYTVQPADCHMTFFRQVLSPLGVYNCPVYRNTPHARVGDQDAYATAAELGRTAGRSLRLISSFDAASECREVTCLYNNANWFVENLIRNPDKLEELTPGPERGDHFL